VPTRGSDWEVATSRESRAAAALRRRDRSASQACQTLSSPQSFSVSDPQWPAAGL